VAICSDIFSKEFSDIIVNYSTVVGGIAAGLWVLFRFGIFREGYPKIEHDIDIAVHGEDKAGILVELETTMNNKGQTRHEVHDFKFSLFYLTADDQFKPGCDEMNCQVKFNPLRKKQSWIPKKWESTFVEPGVCQRYSYITTVPKEARYLLLISRFDYSDDESGFHTAQRVWNLDDLRKK